MTGELPSHALAKLDGTSAGWLASPSGRLRVTVALAGAPDVETQQMLDDVGLIPSPLSIRGGEVDEDGLRRLAICPAVLEISTDVFPLTPVSTTGELTD